MHMIFALNDMEEKNMVENNINVYTANTIQEVLYHLKNVSNIEVFAGTTLCKKHSLGSKIKLPKSCIFINNIDELKEITKTERYIDFGSAVTINQVLEAGKNRLPPFLLEAAASIASHNIGNIATIGGNVCNLEHRMSLVAPLLALDASIEMRSSSEIKHIALSKFTYIPKGFFITKIRVPITYWQTAMFVKIGNPYEQNEKSATYTFLADSSKGSNLDDLRIAFAGDVCFRSRELENTLIGARLPLNEKECSTLIEKASKLYDEECERAMNLNNSFLKNQFLNLLEQSLDELKHY